MKCVDCKWLASIPKSMAAKLDYPSYCACPEFEKKMMETETESKEEVYCRYWEAK